MSNLSNRELEPRDTGAHRPPSKSLTTIPSPRDADVVPFVDRFVSSERRAAIFVVVNYIGTVMIAAAFLELLEVVQNYQDMRTGHATIIFGVVMAFPFGWAFLHAFRRPKPPTFQRRLSQ